MDLEITFCLAGDMYSNVLDLVRWGRVIIKHGELDGKHILNKESVQETLNGYTFMNKKRRGPKFAPVQSYGLGWSLDSYKGQIIYRHNGSVPGYRSELALVPNSDLVIACLASVDAVLLSNISYHVLDEILDLPKTQDWIASEFVKETLGIYENYANMAKSDLSERIENRPPAHVLGAYVGDYSHPVYGNVFIRLEKNKKDGTEDEEELLFFKMRTFDSKVKHYHFDSFKAFLHDFVVKLTILVSFQTDQDGKVEGFKVDFGHGPLEFRRE
ncbi:hypothetical protein BGX21_005047 [Mortierella sp. AD011]|nr:hypothetical protein BGX20_010954 [Mortierella sp. AD010]KAF9400068.1 hypothetical protein BGX21_005047 [Mortierella sp. AD011]